MGFRAAPGDTAWPRDDLHWVAPTSVITTFQSGHGFTQSGAAGTVSDDTSVHVSGSQSLKLVTDGAGGACKARKTAMPAVNFVNKAVRIKLRVSGLTRASVVSLQLGDTTFTNYFTGVLISERFKAGQTDDFSAFVRDSEWVTLLLPFSTFGTGGGSPVRAAITDWQVQAQDNAAGSITVNVNEISVVPVAEIGPSGGVVSFWFDDGFPSQYTVAKPALDAFGWGADLSLIAQSVDTLGGVLSDRQAPAGGALTLAQLQEMDRGGWDIGCHAWLTATHDLTHGYTDVSVATFEAEMVLERAWLQANGLGRGRDVYAYPHGAWTVGAGSMEAIMRRHFMVARTIDSTQMEAALPQNPYRVAAYGYAFNTTTLASLKVLVDKCVRSGGWLIFTFHNLTASPTVSTDYLTSDFQALVAYVAVSGLPVMTATQALRAMRANTGTTVADTQNAAAITSARPVRVAPGEYLSQPSTTSTASTTFTLGQLVFTPLDVAAPQRFTGLGMSLTANAVGGTTPLIHLGLYPDDGSGSRPALTSPIAGTEVTFDPTTGGTGDKFTLWTAALVLPVGRYWCAFTITSGTALGTPPTIVTTGIMSPITFSALGNNSWRGWFFNGTSNAATLPTVTSLGRTVGPFPLIGMKAS